MSERTVLVGLVTRLQDERKTDEYLDELAFLADTAGAEPVARFTQRLDYPNPRTYVGTGRLERCVKDLARTSLILDIFAKRAQTATARTQVELAQYQYLLPRLTRMWTHLERQRGGIGMRGPGETQIETDRRTILTLMNLLSKSEVFAENKLFATLDTTVRKVVVENLPFLLTDTVGFIRKLPSHLVESFKSTLDEVREADVLVHVVDISHPNFEEQIEVVNKTLADVCGNSDKPVIMVFNKIDAFSYTPKDPDDLTPATRENISLPELQRTWMSRMDNNCVFISPKDKLNIEELKQKLYEKAREIHTERFPYNDFLYQKYEDLEAEAQYPDKED